MRRLPRIASVATNVGNHRVIVGFDPHQTSANAVRAVERAGYGAAQVDAGAGPAAAPVDDDVEERYLSQAWSRLIFAPVSATCRQPWKAMWTRQVSPAAQVSGM
jgi:P-type Cu+ transporter